MKLFTSIGVAAALAIAVVGSPVSAAKPATASLVATPGSGCDPLPATKSCMTLTVTFKNYVPNVTAAYSETYTRVTRNGTNLFTSEGYFFTGDGNRTFSYGSVVCDVSRPWYVWSARSPVVLTSNILRVC